MFFSSQMSDIRYYEHGNLEELLFCVQQFCFIGGVDHPIRMRLTFVLLMKASGESIQSIAEKIEYKQVISDQAFL